LRAIGIARRPSSGFGGSRKWRGSREKSSTSSAEDWDAALDLLDQLEKEPLDDDLQQLLQVKRMRLFVLQNAGRGEEAAQLQAEIVEQAWDSPMLLNEIAWGIAMGDGVRDLDLALKAAQRASELQEHGDPSTLDTLARIYYEKGELDQAIEWQKKAVEQSQGDPSLQATLKKYEDEKASPPGAAAPPPEGGPAGVEQ